MIQDQRQQEVGFGIALRAAILAEGKILLLLRSRPSKGETGYWELPGGRMNLGECYEEAVKREVYEETGLKISVVKPLTVYDSKRDKDTQVIGIIFLCALDASNPKVQLSSEHLDSMWVSLEDLGTIKVIPGLSREAQLWEL
ncbi:NUDIX hydrolase [Acidaminobacter hydrogenoformans]|uniref:8-oxo-dGTP diphosphatase n=1 Tax=Acidaminobacter hydrogenoformans DSM 2784 TaxID=1120920 RepID=A0A1G5RU86_9FIRM|nr:NUDIX domain-containing protein [Acidaminobacter hydrogenoformans]SCZ77705.1 8-oxo-dGTP diphosphatase [Acidaminobacter hydrogenoformans DSM 2784]